MAYPAPLLQAVARGEDVSADEVTLAVAEMAVEHRMAALVLRSVIDQSRVPAAALALLMAADMSVVARRASQERALRTVRDQLVGRGVTHTFVKGPVSAIRWFDDPTNRPYADIDVIVPKGMDFVSAVAALDASNPAIKVLGAHGAEAVSSVGVFVEGVSVDLQTDALRSGLTPLSYREWSVGTDWLGAGWGLPVLDAEHDLVMFLLHQGRDRFRFLLGVAEARSRLEHVIDWQRVESIARREGIWEQIAVAVEVMCQELGLDPPVSPPSGWRTRLWRRLWRPEVRLLGEVGRVRHIVRGRWLMPLTMKGRTIDGLGHVIRSVFPPDAVLRLKYPRARGPYLWRVFASRARVISRRRLWVWGVDRGDQPDASDRTHSGATQSEQPGERL